MKTLTLPLSDIVIGDRFRKQYENIEELADSLREVGQIHPPLITLVDDKYQLVAGGRRMRAFKLLGWTHAVFTVKDTLTEDEQRELELEENLQREGMTWQEEVLAIAEIHRLKAKRNALEGKSWGYRQTGHMLNMSIGRVSYCLKAAAEIRSKPEGEVAKAGSLMDVLRIFDKREEEAALAELARRSTPKPVTPEVVVNDEAAPVTEPAGSPDAHPQIALSKMLFHTQIESSLPTMRDQSVDHIITDPPYGIDMDMLDQKNPHGGMNDIDSVREEHDVAYNEALFNFMIPEFYRVLKPTGFLCMWCDIMQWQLLYDLCIGTGFKVQRWPIVWHKTSACMNQSAQYNFTKNHELVMVCRKGNATLVQPAPSSIVVSGHDEDRRRFGHPFVKPYGVWEFLLRHTSIQGQLIYEPFAGVGSGVLAMLRMGRRVLATECNENHFNRLVENVKQHYLSVDKNTQFV